MSAEREILTDERANEPALDHVVIDGFKREAGAVDAIGMRWENMAAAPVPDEPISISVLADDVVAMVNVPDENNPETSIVGGLLKYGGASVVLTQSRLLGLYFVGETGDGRRIDVDRGVVVAFSAPLLEVGFVSVDIKKGLLGGRKDAGVAIGLRYGAAVRNGAHLSLNPKHEVKGARQVGKVAPRNVADLIVSAAIDAQLPHAQGARLEQLQRAREAGWSEDGDDSVIRDLWGDTAPESKGKLQV